MWFWKRKEIYHGFDMGMQANVRDILAANRIKYEVKVVNLNQKTSNGSSLGLNFNYVIEYYIYVSTDDYEKAVFFLNKNRNGR
jgi:hypothetical protein